MLKRLKPYKSPYCYPHSDTLKNKLNIKNADKLEEAERKIAEIRVNQLYERPVHGDFDFDHLKAIHKHIFQDIYDWAGEIRTVNISKGTAFCAVQDIPGYAADIFDSYADQCIAAKGDQTQFVKVLTKHFGDLNNLHPFREGNGRTQREFARELCLHCGYNFDISNISRDQMIDASVRIRELSDYSAMEQLFRKAVTPISKETHQKQEQHSDRRPRNQSQVEACLRVGNAGIRAGLKTVQNDMEYD